MTYAGRRVLVAGARVAGIASARALLRAGATVTVVDAAAVPALEELAAQGARTAVGTGVDLLAGQDEVVVSPGFAPHHPLAAAAEPLEDGELVRHRAIAVADSAQRLPPITVNLQPGQDVLTVSDMSAKIDALLRGLGAGFVPEAMARDHIAAGRLVVKSVQRNRLDGRLGYAWRTPVAGKRGPGARKPALGLALRWWLEQLDSETTRKALLDRHGGRVGDRIR